MQGLKYMLEILFGWAMGLGWNFFLRWYGSEKKTGGDGNEDREFGDLLVKVALLFLAIFASIFLFAMVMMLLK